ncbi:hypothetical protein CDD83_6410 [Cordyceps sp. RAO-2017]|nr:hypothetical protein CDD83_6410 [Cordyceps sp. RAO-2017]
MQTLYGDIALTVARALVEGNKGVRFTGFDVSDMKIDRPLIALPSETTHLFRASASADWASQIVTLSLYSVDEAGNRTASHAAVNVRLVEDQAIWLNEWKPTAYLINGRIASLESAVASGNSHKLKRSMVYKLFGSLVDYSQAYQGMQEVILDSDELEATAKVSFRVDDQGFVMNPHWIDSLGHLAGFIMNGNENMPSHKQVFINHGWSRLRFGENPEAGKVYTTYNKMQLVQGKLYAGDTYVLDGQRIVAIFEKVAFQGVPRQVLDNLLPGKTVTPRAAKLGGTTISAATTTISAATTTISAETTTKAAQRQAAAPPASKASQSGDFSRVLTIIAEEVRIELSELQPDSQFADFGLDSLLSLTVTSRINDEIGIDLPWKLFAAYPTVKDLQSLIDPLSSVPRETPELTASSHTGDDQSRDSTSAASEDENFRFIIRQTIADETGTPAEDLVPSACLADLGVDSLLSLSIADSLTEALGAHVSSSHFLENGTLEEMEAALGKALGLHVADLVGASSMNAAVPMHVPIALEDNIVSGPPHATSIVLHGVRNAVPRRTLFLLPDGSGSAASYASLAKLDPGLAVYGLNCPWRTTPEEMRRLGVTTSQVVAKFVAEIRSRQAHGPYFLGGWSAGGIFAYEAARALMAAGETVEKLLLVDAPNPIGLENPPSRMFDFFESAGVFGGMGGAGKAVPRWLRHHFDSVVNMLDGYRPEALPGAPPTLAIYARDGICKDRGTPRIETRPDDPREMLWLLHDRTDFSASGWSSLLGPGNVAVLVLDNVNHFTMMNDGPHMDIMREHVRRQILPEGI